MSSPTDLDANTELGLVPGFSDLALDARSDLATLVNQRRVHAQLSLVEQGVQSQVLQVLVRGAAKVVRTTLAEGGESTVVLDVMRAPCIIGDPSVIDGLPALASVITLRSSHLFSFDRRALLKLCAIYPQLARVMMARYAQEIRSFVRRIDEVVTGPVDERVKHLLESLALQHGTLLGQGRFIAIPLRRRDIACMVNATTETVSRLLAKFEREGLARSTRDGIWWRTAARPPAAPASTHESDRPAPASSGVALPAIPNPAIPQDRRG
jgi:CRP-like cAMP-binding protein